jgi:hypothetical protein
MAARDAMSEMEAIASVGDRSPVDAAPRLRSSRAGG